LTWLRLVIEIIWREAPVGCVLHDQAFEIPHAGWSASFEIHSSRTRLVRVKALREGVREGGGRKERPSHVKVTDVSSGSLSKKLGCAVADTRLTRSRLDLYRIGRSASEGRNEKRVGKTRERSVTARGVGSGTKR